MQIMRVPSIQDSFQECEFTVLIALVGQKLTSCTLSNRLPGDGRVMVDVRGYRKANPTQDIWP